MRGHLSLTLCTALTVAACGTDRPEATITAEGILSDVEVLSADDMEGRGAATQGEVRATAFIAQRFQEIGLACPVQSDGRVGVGDGGGAARATAAGDDQKEDNHGEHPHVPPRSARSSTCAGAP